jgi:conjugal transfer mating pair stabilization protein TraN
MKILTLLSLMTQLVFADAFEDAKNRVKDQRSVIPLEQTGLPVIENPPEASIKTPEDIQARLNVEKQQNETFKRIRHVQETRDVETIDIRLPKTSEKLDDKNTFEHGASINSREPSPHQLQLDHLERTCRVSGESYPMTCKRSRIIEIHVTPEVIAYNPIYCRGHRACSQRDISIDSCSGCCGGDAYVFQQKKVDITRDEWVGCEREEEMRDRGDAEIISEVVGPLNQTRMIQKEPIKLDYFETTRTYALNTKKINECKEYEALGCRLMHSRCVEEKILAEGGKICLLRENTYRCQLVAASERPQTTDKFGIKIPTGPKTIANQNMVKALSQLEAMRQMSKHMVGGEHDLKIFRGDAMSCTTNFGGSFKDCCKSDGGVGVNMKLSTECTAEEKNLQRAKSENRCFFVGSKSKNKTLGINFSKEYVYCCWPTKLSAAVQMDGRSQLGFGEHPFGTPDSPECRGLTPDELSRVDFDRVDLSSVYADVMATTQKMTRIIQSDLQPAQTRFKTDAHKEGVEKNQEDLAKAINAAQEGNGPHEYVF